MIPDDEIRQLQTAVESAKLLARDGQAEQAEARLFAGLQRVEKLVYDALVAGTLEDWMAEWVRN